MEKNSTINPLDFVKDLQNCKSTESGKQFSIMKRLLLLRGYDGFVSTFDQLTRAGLPVRQFKGGLSSMLHWLTFYAHSDYFCGLEDDMFCLLAPYLVEHGAAIDVISSRPIIDLLVISAQRHCDCMVLHAAFWLMQGVRNKYWDENIFNRSNMSEVLCGDSLLELIEKQCLPETVARIETWIYDETHF